MANTKLLFKESTLFRSDEIFPYRELEVFHNINDELSVVISAEACPSRVIYLDVETAIKLSKELKKQIASIKEGGRNVKR